MGRKNVFSDGSIYNIIMIMVLMAVFGFTCIKAYVFPITLDEANTFILHASSSFLNILAYSTTDYVMPNNHILNTMLIKVFAGIFGVSEFVIRIPALIGHLLYLIFLYKTLRLFLKGHDLLIGILLLALNPLTLAYFSVARGYSLALGFMMLGLYCLFKRIQQKELSVKHMAFACLALGLSVMSNFAFVYPSVSILAVFFVVEFRNFVFISKKGDFKGRIFIFIKRIMLNEPFWICLFFSLMLFTPVTKTMHICSSDSPSSECTGWDYGLLKDYAESIIKHVTNNNEYLTSVGDYVFVGALVFAAALFMILCCLMIYKLIKKTECRQADAYLIVTTLVLLVSFLAIMTASFLFDTKFPFGRTAMFFVPLFFIFVLLLLEKLKNSGTGFVRISSKALFYLFALILLVYSLSCLSFYESPFFIYDLSLESALDDVEKISSQHNENGVSVGVYNLLQSCVNFYIIKNNLIDIKQIIWDDKSPDGEYDYYYLFEKDKELIKKYNLTMIKRYERSGSYLAVPATDDSMTI